MEHQEMAWEDRFDAIDYHDEYTIAFFRDEEGEYGRSQELDPYLALTSDDFTDAPRIEIEGNAPAGWDVEVPYSPELEKWALQHAFIWYDGELILRGRLQQVSSDDGGSRTTLAGHGILTELKKQGESITVRNETYRDAIKNYVENRTEFSIDVRDEEIEEVDTNQLTIEMEHGDDFGDRLIADPNANVNATINGLEVARSVWFFEARSGGYLGQEITNSNFSDGTGVRLSNSPEEGYSGHHIEFTFSPDYSVAADDLEVFVRAKSRDSTGLPNFKWELLQDSPSQRGNLLDEHDIRNDRQLSLGWQRVTGRNFSDDTYDGPDLDAEGTYRLRCETTEFDAAQNHYGYDIDCVAVVDSSTIDTRRFHTHWDTLHDGYLNGPPRGGSVTVRFDPEQVSYRIARGRIETDITDTSGRQQIQMSVDDGANWLPRGDLSRNRDSVSTAFVDTFGTVIQARITLDTYTPNGTPQNKSPRFGYAGQQIYNFKLYRDTDTLPVIDEKDLTGTHYKNILDLHTESGRIFAAVYDENDMDMISLVPGTVERDLSDVKVINHTRNLDATNYANIIRIHGASQSFTWFHSAEIERRGEQWHTIFEPDVADLKRLRAIGRPILREKVREDDLKGDMEIVPTPLLPGVAYKSEYFDGEPMVLERATYDDKRQPSASLSFMIPKEFGSIFREVSRRIARIRR